jgi:hypothetical protein
MPKSWVNIRDNMCPSINNHDRIESPNHEKALSPLYVRDQSVIHEFSTENKKTYMSGIKIRIRAMFVGEEGHGVGSHHGCNGLCKLELVVSLTSPAKLLVLTLIQMGEIEMLREIIWISYLNKRLDGI